MGRPGVPSAIRAVTPDDANDLPGGSARISVSTSGAYAVIAHSDTVSVIINMTAGVVHPTLIKRVLATGSVSTAGIAAHYE